MAVLTAILFAATVGLVYLTMVRAGAPTLLAFVFAFASLVLQAVHLHPRPHMFTTLLVAVFSFLLLEARRDGQMKRLLLLPPLMMIWANLHGGFLVGFILLFMFGIDAGLVWWSDRGGTERPLRRVDRRSHRSLSGGFAAHARQLGSLAPRDWIPPREMARRLHSRVYVTEFSQPPPQVLSCRACAGYRGTRDAALTH